MAKVSCVIGNVVENGRQRRDRSVEGDRVQVCELSVRRRTREPDMGGWRREKKRWKWKEMLIMRKMIISRVGEAWYRRRTQFQRERTKEKKKEKWERSFRGNEKNPFATSKRYFSKYRESFAGVCYPELRELKARENPCHAWYNQEPRKICPSITYTRFPFNKHERGLKGKLPMAEPPYQVLQPPQNSPHICVWEKVIILIQCFAKRKIISISFNKYAISIYFELLSTVETFLSCSRCLRVEKETRKFEGQVIFV